MFIIIVRGNFYSTASSWKAKDFIVLRLEEMERENTFRLKRIKG